MRSNVQIDQLRPTSQFYLPDAHVHHHGSRGVVRFDQRGEIAAVDLLYPAQVWLAVAGNQFGALFVYIQAAIWEQKTVRWRREKKGGGSD